MVAEQVEAKRLVFVDEMGTNISLSPLYAWAPRGERALCSVPRNRGSNTTILSSMTLEGMGPFAHRRGRDHLRGLRSLRGADPGSHAAQRSSGGDGQPERPQRREGKRAHRRAGLRTLVPAVLLAGLQPDRRSPTSIRGSMKTMVYYIFGIELARPPKVLLEQHLRQPRQSFLHGFADIRWAGN
jgi:hypothetical protein